MQPQPDLQLEGLRPHPHHLPTRLNRLREYPHWLNKHLQQQQVHLTLHAVNPNARAIDVRGIDCNLELNGEAFAAAVTDGLSHCRPRVKPILA